MTLHDTACPPKFENLAASLKLNMSFKSKALPPRHILYPSFFPSSMQKVKEEIRQQKEQPSMLRAIGRSKNPGGRQEVMW